MYSERDLIHDLVNKLSIAQGYVSRICRKPEKYNQEDLLKVIKLCKDELDQAFEHIKQRKEELVEAEDDSI